MTRGAIDRRALLGGALSAALHRVQPRGVDAQCETIELYPGYPGYRGNITGLVGAGDVACLEDLERASPSFDRPTVDATNRAAGVRLGLLGTPGTWTWENWMAIEGERGLVPTTCYSCAIDDGLDRSAPIAPIRRDDPRLLLGTFASTDALGRLLTEHNLPGWSLRSLLQYDYDLRALSGMAYPGHWSAPERRAQYDAVVSSLANGGWFDLVPLLNNLLAQGGYAPTPPTAHPDDQVVMIYAAIPVLSRLLDPFG